MASVRQSPTPLDRLLMDFTVVLSPVSPMDMVLDMEDTDMLVDTMVRGRLMLMPTPLDRLLMVFTVVLSPVSPMAMVLDMEGMDMVLDMDMLATFMDKFKSYTIGDISQSLYF